MKTEDILLGFEVGTGKEIKIAPAHLVVTGITQESGKTTTLEALVKRGRFKAIFFKTKIGEAAIREGTLIAPYYKDVFDWEYACEILEASRKEKLKFERSWIIKYSKTANNLIEFKSNIDQALTNKLRELEKSVLITLQAYLEKIIPELQYAPLSNTLNLNEGINIMDIERFREETQSLVIRSTLLEILRHYKNTVVVLPEAWRYIPERIGSPVKRQAETFIRQGAGNNNYLWMDSQDITGVSKVLLKAVSNWVLGYQREINEINRTIDQIPLSKKKKPKPEDIASLKLGQFFVATSEFVKKVYVQLAWLGKKTAIEVAMGRKDVTELERPKIMVPLSIQPQEQKQIQAGPPIDNTASLRAEIIEMRNDFFNKLQAFQTTVNNLMAEIYALKSTKQEVNINEIVSLVLQKIPIPASVGTIDISKIVAEVRSQIPAGGAVYQVAPLEKIKKDFMEDAKNKIISDVKQLTDEQKKVLRYIETKQQDVAPSELITKCLLLKVGGSQSTKMSNILKGILTVECVEKTAGGRYRRGLAGRIKTLMGNHDATEHEIEQVYNHVLMELL